MVWPEKYILTGRKADIITIAVYITRPSSVAELPGKKCHMNTQNLFTQEETVDWLCGVKAFSVPGGSPLPELAQ